MTAFQIKMLAIITMVIDHIGLFFFPQIIWLRMIGRLSFPLFAWLIANGARHTHNIRAYLIRLLLFALIAQLPFFLANRRIDPNFFTLNVLFTLFLGLVVIFFIKRTQNPSLWVFITVVSSAAAQLLHTDYGAVGVVMVVLFYLFFKNFRSMLIAQSLLMLGMVLFVWGDWMGLLEPLGLVSLLFISLYNSKPGPKAKYLFYIFYPLQYVVFYYLLR